MTALNQDLLFPLIHDYLKIYLPKQRQVSPNTVRSYRKALESLLDYVKEQKQVSLGKITFEMLTADTILSFLSFMDEQRGYSAATRNTRFAAIRAFLDYASDRDMTVTAVLNTLRKIPFKKAETFSTVEYMSMKAVTAIVEQTDAGTPKGLRDRTFIILMYDTGARVQEMLDVNLSDLQLNQLPKITLHGKGNKTRTVPLMSKTVQYLRKYLTVFHDGTSPSESLPFFYSISQGEKRRLTDRLIRYMLQKYGERAKATCPEVPESVHPHQFRHSRAMHLYQEGMDLTLISQWLGHSQLETTQIYAHADTEHKRKAIAAATPQENPLTVHLNSTRFTVNDEEMLKRLAGLK